MLKTAMIFGNGMVLQRGKPIPVWGEAEPNTKVTVILGDDSSTYISGEDGKWMAELPPREASTDLKLYIKQGEDEICYTDVCVGEVWLAGGQSNMEYPLAFDADADEVLRTERNPLIRFFDYPEVSYEGELEDFNYNQYGFWRGCTEADLPYFSAVGYYFAHNIQEKLGIPVGIVGCNWGGTTACSWMDPAFLADNEGKVWLEDYEKATDGLDIESYQAAFKANPMNDRTRQLEDPMNIKLVKIGLAREEQLNLIAQMDSMASQGMPVLIGPYYERRPGGLYETMLKKVAPYGIHGVLFYQGESDDEHAQAYRTVFEKLIENWRELWKEELPFLFVQLAPFGEWMACNGSKYPVLRAAQEHISKSVPGTWMAASGDCGMEWDIHPKKKKPIGERLALLARGHIYGEQLLCDAPELKKAVKEGKNVILEFDHGQSLRIQGETLGALEMLDGSGQSISVEEVTVSENKVILKGCVNASQIRFAQSGYYEINLYNQSDIPAKPFTAMLEAL